MGFTFRLRVRCSSPPDAQEPSTIELSGLRPIHIVLNGASDPAGHWVIFMSEGYAFEAEARDAGETFLRALLLAAALDSSGVDPGSGRSKLAFGHAVHQQVREETGTELRADVHGLMVYPDGQVTIWGLHSRATSFCTLLAFSDQLNRALRTAVPTERQANAIALLNDSFFVANVEGSFVLRISAVEALCGKDFVPGTPQLVEKLEMQLSVLDGDPEAKAHVLKSLGFARQMGPRGAYMAHFRRHLGEAAAREFDQLYGLRSKLVHDGIGRGTLSAAHSRALGLAVRLLDAQLS
jgi:hypothetical protein